MRRDRCTQAGFVPAWDDAAEQGNSLTVGSEACAGGNRVDLLTDFRCIASARGMIVADWMNVVDDETSCILEEAGYARNWEDSGYLYERQNTSKPK